MVDRAIALRALKFGKITEERLASIRKITSITNGAKPRWQIRSWRVEFPFESVYCLLTFYSVYFDRFSLKRIRQYPNGERIK